jgi:dihydrofolate reductase
LQSILILKKRAVGALFFICRNTQQANNQLKICTTQMRKLKFFIHLSLDGFAAGPNGEMDWIKVDEEMFDFVKTFTDNADTAMYGRKTWEMMDSYWPTAGDKPNASKHDKEHSAWYEAVEKVVLSDSMKGRKKEKTVFIGGDVVTQIRELKQMEGKDIMIFGSPSVGRSLMKDEVIDEYWLFMNPMILGQGIEVFPSLESRIALTRQASVEFSCGVTALNYIKG